MSELRVFTLKSGLTVAMTICFGEMARGSFNRYHAMSTAELTEQDAMEVQEAAGFHPSGYGVYGFKCARGECGFLSVWRSSVHCD